MKKAVNLRLDEGIIIVLNQLSKELNTTKTEVVEKAIQLFSKNNKTSHNNLIQFAGKLKDTDATKMLEAIMNDKNTKNFDLEM